MANSKKTAPATSPAKEKKPNLDGQLMTWTGAGRETNENFITAAPVNGKERWFIKKQIASGSHKDGQITINATRREFRYRNMEDVATPVA